MRDIIRHRVCGPPTHREEDSYEDYIKKIARSGNQAAVQVKLNDLRHNLLRAEDAVRTLDTSNRKTQELFDLIVDIAAVHERAEDYIRHTVMPLS